MTQVCVCVWGVCVGYCTCWPRFGCKKLIFFPCLPSWECTPPFPYLPPLSKRDQRSGKVKVQTQTQRQPKSCSFVWSLESTTANLLAPKLTWTLGLQCCLLPIVGNTFLYVICYQQQFVLPPCNPPCATLFKAHLIANINISFPNASLSLFLSRSPGSAPYLAGALIMWAGFNSISHRISCVMSTGNFSSRMACAVAIQAMAMWWKRSNEKKETATW